MNLSARWCDLTVGQMVALEESVSLARLIAYAAAGALGALVVMWWKRRRLPPMETITFQEAVRLGKAQVFTAPGESSATWGDDPPLWFHPQGPAAPGDGVPSPRTAEAPAEIPACLHGLTSARSCRAVEVGTAEIMGSMRPKCPMHGAEAHAAAAPAPGDGVPSPRTAEAPAEIQAAFAEEWAAPGDGAAPPLSPPPGDGVPSPRTAEAPAEIPAAPAFLCARCSPGQDVVGPLSESPLPPCSICGKPAAWFQSSPSRQRTVVAPAPGDGGRRPFPNTACPAPDRLGPPLSAHTGAAVVNPRNSTELRTLDKGRNPVVQSPPSAAPPENTEPGRTVPKPCGCKSGLCWQCDPSACR